MTTQGIASLRGRLGMPARGHSSVDAMRDLSGPQVLDERRALADGGSAALEGSKDVAERSCDWERLF